MPITLTKEPIVQENPIIQNYLNNIKVIYEIEMQMSPKEMRILTERLSSCIFFKKVNLSETTYDYLTIRDVSKLLGISPQMVRRKCNSRKIKAW